MKALLRWGKFNLVGAMGMGVQLAGLALFARWMPGHYLLASAAAIELTLLHNFVWHWNFTWKDRRADHGCAPRLLRFHLSNGLVSMVGNLALMRLLAYELRMPLLVSNAAAIVCCSVVNYFLGNNWAFAVAPLGRGLAGIFRPVHRRTLGGAEEQAFQKEPLGQTPNPGH